MQFDPNGISPIIQTWIRESKLFGILSVDVQQIIIFRNHIR